MSGILEPEYRFEYTESAIPGQHNQMTRVIRRKKGNSEAEDKQVLLALDLASLISCSTNEGSANIRQRRRAQNRASQRAFRERKRSHTENLQQQLDELQETHKFLKETYQHNVDELSNMKAYVDQLNLEITMLQTKPDLQHRYFDATDTNRPWQTRTLESPPSHFEPRSDQFCPTNFTTSLDFAIDQINMEAALGTDYSSSPSTASSSAGAELVWS